MTVKLIRYDAACKAIAACVRVDEAKRFRDLAIGMKAYAKQAKNEQMEADAVEIRMRATRRIDELRLEQARIVGLATGGEHGGRRKKDGLRKNPSNARPTLKDAGVDKNLANQARSLGRLTSAQFEKAVVSARKSVTDVVRRAVRVSNIDALRDSYDKRTENGGSYRDLQQMIRDGRKFAVIYVDPPWTYKTYSGKGKERSAERHYDTMSIDELKAMPIWKLAAKDCTLFMWATWPHMQNAFEVIKCWGFEYKTAAFDWIKTNKNAKIIKPNGKGLHTGMGHWTRANSEPCILATIGQPIRMRKNVHQVVLNPMLRHSEKPEETRVRIERLLRGPYLELFGRKLVSGWTVWGNEVPFQAPTEEYLEAAE